MSLVKVWFGGGSIIFHVEIEARLMGGGDFCAKGEKGDVEKKEEGEVDQFLEEKKEKIAEEEDIPDQEVNTRENDAYHEHILNLLKIQNNSTLNSSFYDIIPTLSRKLLLNTDLSANVYIYIYIYID